jgi:hypothetical protein
LLWRSQRPAAWVTRDGSTECGIQRASADADPARETAATSEARMRLNFGTAVSFVGVAAVRTPDTRLVFHTGPPQITGGILRFVLP